jgi:hypothetical protein
LLKLAHDMRQTCSGSLTFKDLSSAVGWRER